MMDHKQDKKTATRSKYLDFTKLASYGIFDNTALEEAATFKTYNSYASYQVERFPEILTAFMQYEGGDDAMFYLQLIWMSDYSKSRKKMAV